MLSSIFIKRSYDRIAEELKIDAFKTAGLLYIIGAGLIIILVGFLVIFIAIIFQIIAFFTLPERVEEHIPPPVPV